MKKFFRFLLFIPRFLFSVTFIISGVLKLMDPVGTGLIFAEYFKTFSLSFLTSASVVFGIVLSVFELLVGISLFARLRVRFFATAALILAVFFTIITFILYKFSPIQDCGCFGEAIHLTNSQTFIKNLLLLVCIVPVFLMRKRYREVAGAFAEWIFLGCHALVALSLSVSLLITHPVIEFGDFRPGANLQNVLEQEWSGVSEDLYVYEKNGETRSFSLSEIPDSTWHFVEVSAGDIDEEPLHSFDFAVSDLNGEYITDTILNHSGPVLLFSVYDPDSIEDDDWDEMVFRAESLEHSGIMSRVLVTGTERCADSLSGLFGISDYKTLISLSRANGGVVLLNSGTIVEKGYYGEYELDELVSLAGQDSDDTASVSCIRGRLFLELIFFLLIASILLFKYFCGIRRDKSDTVTE